MKSDLLFFVTRAFIVSMTYTFCQLKFVGKKFFVCLGILRTLNLLHWNGTDAPSRSLFVFLLDGLIVLFSTKLFFIVRFRMEFTMSSSVAPLKVF